MRSDCLVQFFILKQKLKVMKACLRGWNHNHFGDIHQNIAIIERDMNDLEKKKERGLQEEFWRNVLYRESLRMAPNSWVEDA